MSKRPRRDDAWLVNSRAKKPRLSNNVDPLTLTGLLPDLKTLIWERLDTVDAARMSQTCHRANIELRPYRVPTSWTNSDSIGVRLVVREALRLDMPRAGCIVRRTVHHYRYCLRFQRDDVDVQITALWGFPYSIDWMYIGTCTINRGRVGYDPGAIRQAIDYLKGGQ